MINEKLKYRNSKIQERSRFNREISFPLLATFMFAGSVLLSSTAFATSCSDDTFYSETWATFSTNVYANNIPNNSNTAPLLTAETINFSGDNDLIDEESVSANVSNNNLAKLGDGSFMKYAQVIFDGIVLSNSFLKTIAKDPIIKWGFVRDDVCEIIHGEVWLIVVRDEKFITFHLVDTPNDSNGTTAYGGYDVKNKIIHTVKFYQPGYGVDVPHFGNDTEMFYIATNKILTNKEYFDNPYEKTVDSVSFSGLEAKNILQHIEDIVLYSNIPQDITSSMTSEPNIVIQRQLPSGTLISETVIPGATMIAASVGELASSTGSPEWCEGAGDATETTYKKVASASIALGALYINAAIVVEAATVTIASGGTLAPEVAGGVVLAGGLNNGAALLVYQGVENVIGPTVGALAEAACDVVFDNPPDLENDLLKIAGNAFNVKAGSITQNVVCDNWEYVEENEGEESDADEVILEIQQNSEDAETSEEVVVSEGPQECAEWHVETDVDSTI